MIRILCLFFLLTTINVAFSAQFYKWYDENGVVHIGDQPPRTSVENTETIRLQDSTYAPSRNIPVYQKNFDQSGQNNHPSRSKAGNNYDRDIKKCKEKVETLMKKAEEAWSSPGLIDTF